MNPLEEAVYRCAEYGGGEPITFHAPEEATVVFDARHRNHPFEGMVIATWL
ncbi:hypothetical protein [Mycobacterium avium]|uniref:hypothetical protein n=1 Tax=Mycobacterium avium TaxID=1764 RepID=UPI001CC4DC27|nr:hypothetical protein [Mycobacterium avium]